MYTHTHTRTVFYITLNNRFQFTTNDVFVVVFVVAVMDAQIPITAKPSETCRRTTVVAGCWTSWTCPCSTSSWATWIVIITRRSHCSATTRFPSIWITAVHSASRFTTSLVYWLRSCSAVTYASPHSRVCSGTSLPSVIYCSSVDDTVSYFYLSQSTTKRLLSFITRLHEVFEGH